MSCVSLSRTRQAPMPFLLTFALGLALVWSVESATAQTGGLVAAYSFGEGTGLTVTDASGRGNTGTIQNATWTTAGKYGTALVFNGTSARINIPDSPSLRLTTAMTLEAWVNPSAVNGAWRDVIYKGDDNYFLEATSPNGGAPGAGAATIGEIYGVSPLPANTWTHLAVTYDGATLRLYVNGVQVSSAPKSGSLPTSPNQLQIGGDSIYGQYFQGMIDEVRVYNVALSQAQIQVDMNAAIVTGPPDSQPPTAPSTLTATVVSSTQINLSWPASTDNVAVTGYSVERCQGAGCTGFAQITTVTATSFNNTGLSGATSYSYRVRATDAGGNFSLYSPVASATTPAAPDTTPPTVPTTLTATLVSATQFNLSWNPSTDNVGVVGYRLERCQGANCTTFAQIAAPTSTSYSDTAVTTKTIYRYRVRAADAAGNLSGFSAIISAGDTTVPSVPSNLSPTVVGGSQINLSWTASTDNVGVAGYQVQRCQGAGCTTFAQIGAPTATSYSDTGLAPATTFRYRVRATDIAGNLGGFSGIVTATTAVAPDTTPPTAPTNLTPSVVSANQINLNWTAATDNVGVTGYRVERCQDTGCTAFTQIATPTVTTYSDPGLLANTTYRYQVRATDAAGNLGPYSNVAQATTPGPDTQPPTAPGTLAANAVSGSQVDLTWGPAQDNVAVANYRVERCEGVGCTEFIKIATPTGLSFSDFGLTPSASYNYVVRAEDAASNLGPYSNVASVTTLATVPELVAAYSFDEGTGTTVADSSGRGNTGTIQNATWTTAGKYGRALVFNGTNARINIPDSPSLRLTTAMTLEAWVNPSVVNGNWSDVIYKGNDNYFLSATSTNGGVPGAGAATLGEVYGLSPLPANTWTHLAVTYDGATMRLYVNGVQVSSTPKTGSLPTSTNQLQIGGDSIYGQYFQGVIDEVRIYNVARTPTQVQADGGTPIGSVTMPIVSLSRASIDFGSQDVGTTGAPQALTLTNTGSGALAISSVTVGGAHGADFVIQTNTCGTGLAPSASCQITLAFRPTAGGSRNATLMIANNAFGSPHTVALTGTATGALSITPSVAVLAPGQTQQFTAGAAVTWAVDGVAGGTATAGTITATGLYTAPSSVGTHTVRATTTDQSRTALATVYVGVYPGTFTHHNDNARTGQNLNETILTPANVRAATFGKLVSYPLDGPTFVSPLYVGGVNIPGQGVHNVVYVATQHNSVYAFDADGLSATPLWKVSFINPAAGVTAVPAGDTGECCDISPEIGITGTPVIDPATGTLYVVAKTKEQIGIDTQYFQKLHALDITTGAEKFGGPVVIQATVPGSGTGSQGGQISFNPLRQNQRPALTLNNGVVYVASGSHGDNQPYHGWILGYNATTLQQVMAHITTPNGDGGGVWMSNAGPAVDSVGNMYFATANGTFNASTGDYGDTVVKISPNGTVLDYFTPFDESLMDLGNIDLGAGGVLLIPDQPGPHPHLLVMAGKPGTIYLVDRDNMGRHNTNNDSQIVQSLVNIFPFGTPEPGNYSAPVYYNGTVYFSPVADAVKAFRLTNGLLSTSPTSQTSALYSYPGGSLAISANGNTNGILWAIERNGTSIGTLHAYDPANLVVELYNSNQAGSRDTMDTAVKFSVPLVANGKVFVGSVSKLTVYGLLP